MSGHGAPDLHPQAAADLTVHIIASSWHHEVMAGLVDGAERAVLEAGADAIVTRVPGTFELTVAAEHLARSGARAIVALGVVIRGGTPHFDYVCDSVTSGLTDVSRTHAVPVGFGVLTCDDEQQALDRAGLPGSSEDKGYEAASAAIAMTAIVGSGR